MWGVSLCVVMGHNNNNANALIPEILGWGGKGWCVGAVGVAYRGHEPERPLGPVGVGKGKGEW